MTDWEIILRFAPIVVSVAALGYAAFSDRRAARKAALDKLDTRIISVDQDLQGYKTQGQKTREDLRERLSVAEQTLRSMPDTRTVNKLQVEVEGIRGDLKAQAETLKGVATSARRMEEFLLEGAKKR